VELSDFDFNSTLHSQHSTLLKECKVIKIEMTESQGQLLNEILDRVLSDLRMEIAATDSPFYKDKLRERKEGIISVMALLKGKS